MTKIKTYNDFEPFSKDQAYWERNQLVAALSKIYPAWLGWHKEKDWEDEWRNIVYIKIPTIKHLDRFDITDWKQLSWHIHEDDLPYFSHLKQGNEEWDGHDTEEKYYRLDCLYPRRYKKTIFGFYKLENNL